MGESEKKVFPAKRLVVPAMEDVPLGVIGKAALARFTAAGSTGTGAFMVVTALHLYVFGKSSRGFLSVSDDAVIDLRSVNAVAIRSITNWLLVLLALAFGTLGVFAFATTSRGRGPELVPIGILVTTMVVAVILLLFSFTKVLIVEYTGGACSVLAAAFSEGEVQVFRLAVLRAKAQLMGTPPAIRPDGIASAAVSSSRSAESSRRLDPSAQVSSPEALPSTQMKPIAFGVLQKKLAERDRNDPEDEK